MATKEFREGAEMVGKAAEAKFNDLGKNVNDLKGKFSEYANQQEVINQTIIDRSDNHEERMRQLEENRYFVRSSRRGVEDLDPIQQDRLVGWLQKLVKEFNSRGFPVNRNQQKFLSNLLQFLGITDEVAEIPDLSMMANFGDSEIHEGIYKIFLFFVYLYANNFDTLKNFEDISDFFKLSEQNKADILRLLEEERIPLLGLDGVINIYDPSRALNSFKPQTLYANVREMTTHPLLEANAPEEIRKLYIQGFAMLAEGQNFCEEQYNYLRSLANVLKCASALENLDQLCTSPQKFPVRKWVDALNTDSFKYSWLLDGAMILCQLPEISKDIVKTGVLEEGAKSLRIIQPKEFISYAVSLCLVESATELFKDIENINGKTNGWEHILEYRNLNLEGAFETEIDELTSLDSSLVDLNFKGTKLSMDTINIPGYIDMSDIEDGFLDKMRSKAERALCETSRSSASKKLKEYYAEADSFISSHLAPYRRANSILRLFGIEQISVKNIMVEPDLNNSALNEDWDDDYSGFMDKISNTLENYSNAAEILVEQLGLFEKGQYHTSIIERKNAEKAEKEKQAQAEREARKFVNIITEQGEYRVGISWTKVENVPFPLDDIREVGYAGGNWFIMAKEQPYYLDDNQKWHKIEGLPLTYIGKVLHCNGFIVLTSSSDGIWMSNNCKDWKRVDFPEDRNILGLVFYKNKYVLFVGESESYSYTEKVLIFSTTEESYYDSTIAWQSDSLDGGKWEKWNDASYTYTGMSLKSNIACNSNILIGSFAYDYSYQSNMKKSSDNACVAYFANSRWKDASWPDDVSMNGEFYFLNNHGIFIDTYRPVVLSENGYEWKQIDGVKPGKQGGICGDVFITKPDSEGQSVISLDGLSVSQLTVSDTGDWDEFAYGDRKVLGVYEKSRHESDLLIGELKIIPQ